MGEYKPPHRRCNTRQNTPHRLQAAPVVLTGYTPSGVKITVMLEELLALGKADAAYGLHIVNIGEGKQFGSDFVKLNPNSKIPILVDHSKTPAQPISESCAILLALAEKFEAFLPTDPVERMQCITWLF